MGVLNVTSIRVVLVILAFGLGLLGQAVVSDAASFEIPATTVGSATGGSSSRLAFTSNSAGNFTDDGGTAAKNESFATYLANNGGTPTLGDYGYFQGVA